MTRFSSVRSQGGLVALLLAVAILTTVATTLVIRQANSVSASGNKIAVTKQRLEAIRHSLIDFATVNNRLPCPAAANVDSGLANQPPIPNPPVACNVVAGTVGTVPWNALGIPSIESFDGWGRKISYHAYRPDNLDPGGAAINVNDASAGLVGSIAFVLISHGATGYGAWLSGGTQMGLLPANPGNVQETANRQISPTYYRSLYSAATVVPSANNHFDDEVVYMTIVNLKTAAGR